MKDRDQPPRPRGPEPVEDTSETVVLSRREYDVLVAAAAIGQEVERIFKPWKEPGRVYIQSEIDEHNKATPGDTSALWRPHKYVGDPPSPRLKAMQSNHEVRARSYGVPWDMIDLRTVYRSTGGICGICHEPVGEDVFSVDHIVPLSKGGPHLLDNLQPAHLSCNSRKGAS